MLVSTSADVALVQEARVEAASVADVESSTRNLGWKMSISACNYGSGGGTSAGVAVGCRSHIGLSDSCERHLFPRELMGRFDVEHVGAVCRGGIHAASG